MDIFWLISLKRDRMTINIQKWMKLIIQFGWQAFASIIGWHWSSRFRCK